MELQLNSKVEFFGVPINALIEKKGDEIKVLLNSETEKNGKTSIKVSEIQAQLKADIKTISGNDVNIDVIPFPKELKSKIEKFTIDVHKIFLYIHKKGDETTFKYALSIAVNNSGNLSFAGLNLKTIGFNIWNITDQDFVKSELKLASFDSVMLPA